MQGKQILVQGSSRSQGDTRRVCDYVLENGLIDFIDLTEKEISHFDYDYGNEGDDFLTTVSDIICNYDDIILVSPIYWYSVSGRIKVFLDRLSDLLNIHKDLGRQLRGKKLGIISCSNDEEIDYDYAMPIRLSADYLGMQYLGHVHCGVNRGALSPASRLKLDDYFKV